MLRQVIGTGAAWYARPAGAGVRLVQPLQLASWDREDAPAQQRLRASRTELIAVGAPMLARFSGPIALRLDVGLPPESNLLTARDLDNYLLPVSSAILTATGRPLASAWATKRHAERSEMCIEPPVAADEPRWPVRAGVTVRVSAESVAYKETIEAAVADLHVLPPGPVSLQVSFTVGPGRNWLNLWKPTIDALDPLLGREIPDRRWRPADGRISELGLHCQLNPAAGWEVTIAIAATPA